MHMEVKCKSKSIYTTVHKNTSYENKNSFENFLGPTQFLHKPHITAKLRVITSEFSTHCAKRG